MNGAGERHVFPESIEGTRHEISELGRHDDILIEHSVLRCFDRRQSVFDYNSFAVLDHSWRQRWSPQLLPVSSTAKADRWQPHWD